MHSSANPKFASPAQRTGLSQRRMHEIAEELPVIVALARRLDQHERDELLLAARSRRRYRRCRPRRTRRPFPASAPCRSRAAPRSRARNHVPAAGDRSRSPHAGPRWSEAMKATVLRPRMRTPSSVAAVIEHMQEAGIILDRRDEAAAARFEFRRGARLDQRDLARRYRDPSRRARRDAHASPAGRRNRCRPCRAARGCASSGRLRASLPRRSRRGVPAHPSSGCSPNAFPADREAAAGRAPPHGPRW